MGPMALHMAPMALLAADDDNKEQFTMDHIVDAHVRGGDLSIVYMNKPISVESSIQTMEQFLAEDKYQVVGFDLDFTSGRAGQDHKNLVNIYNHYKVSSSSNNKQNSLVDLVSAIIDPYYMKMEDESKDKNAWQSVWDHSLDEQQVKYATKDVYTSYDMYRRLVHMKKCLHPTRDEGSSQCRACHKK
ncbi:putative methyltransferase PMT27 [Hordeum vulgare]|nr:putative methyltransferase PMT27 [Hordeum vulgare]